MRYKVGDCLRLREGNWLRSYMSIDPEKFLCVITHTPENGMYTLSSLPIDESVHFFLRSLGNWYGWDEIDLDAAFYYVPMSDKRKREILSFVLLRDENES